MKASAIEVSSPADHYIVRPVAISHLGFSKLIIIISSSPSYLLTTISDYNPWPRKRPHKDLNDGRLKFFAPQGEEGSHLGGFGMVLERIWNIPEEPIDGISSTGNSRNGLWQRSPVEQEAYQGHKHACEQDSGVQRRRVRIRVHWENMQCSNYSSSQLLLLKNRLGAFFSAKG